MTNEKNPGAAATAPGADVHSKALEQADNTPTEAVGQQNAGKVDRESERERAAAEISRLASLTPSEYEIERNDTAAALSMRRAALDKAVEEKREYLRDIHDDRLCLVEVEPKPWEEEVSGNALLGELTNLIRRFMVVDCNTIITAALWIVGTYVFESFMLFPRLTITSPEKRCGKTTFLDILAALVCRQLMAANISAAAVFRVISSEKPTLLIDEADRFLKRNEELIGVLNAGHRRDGTVIRNVPVGKNDWQPEKFSVYSPAVIAGIGDVPDTLADRSVFAPLRRKLKTEKVERLQANRMHDFITVKRKIIRWVEDNRDVMEDIDPAIPQELFNRAADNWLPLIAIADAMGGEWPERSRSAAIAAVTAQTDESVGTLLLSDLRELFEERREDILFTPEILSALHNMEHRPWPEMSRGWPLSAVGLAGILKPFNLKPKTVRRGEHTGKGYKRSALEEVFRGTCSRRHSVTPSRLGGVVTS